MNDDHRARLEAMTRMVQARELPPSEVNPKELAATRDEKPQLHLLEHAAEVEIAAVMAHGAGKYGRKNFKQTPILANVYGGAIRRHVGAWLNGEDIDPDSGHSHLAHIGANIHVLLAAMEAGTFQDDRGPEEQSDVQRRLADRSNGTATYSAKGDGTTDDTAAFKAAIRGRP